MKIIFYVWKASIIDFKKFLLFRCRYLFRIFLIHKKAVVKSLTIANVSISSTKFNSFASYFLTCFFSKFCKLKFIRYEVENVET